MNRSEPTIESQIEFLKECYRVSAIALLHHPDKSRTAERSESHLRATIRLLETLRDDGVVRT